MAFIYKQYQEPTPEEKMQRAMKQPLPFHVLLDKTLALSAAIIFVVLVAHGYQYYSKADCVNENNLETIPQCITEPVKHERLGEKNPVYSYTFKFRGHNLECRFYDTYYDYAPNASLLSTLVEGDTVTVQIDKANLGFFNNQYSEGRIELLNVTLKNDFLVDHSYRNACFNSAHRNDYFVFLIAFMAIILLILLKILLKKTHAFGLFPARE
ncbi:MULTISPECIES: hypothetical protein [Niastella]|uniref:DUF3592 domain-containing protein n=1 Tax=Niastella soli TaxID=2821487 RepID=A0ABS3YMH6_9BACT|nr:hypothetical protein [Niastella soli]MBO9199094.1 hypothetical protein [Niastella soli]